MMASDGSEFESSEEQVLKAYLAGAIHSGDVAVSLGVSRSQMYRIVNRYRTEGASGLTSKRIGLRNRGISADVRAQILSIVREKYHDFGPTLAAEKLHEIHNIKVSVETLRTWMKEEGLWSDRRRKAPRVYQIREPRPCVGELVQVDGSYQRWFEK